MRATEFVKESKQGKLKKRFSKASMGVHKFRDDPLQDRFYEFNRIGMAVASTDGSFVPNMNSESWVGRYNTAHPYTEVEHDMLERAYQAVGSEYHEEFKDGKFQSQELDSTNCESPIVPFKGYK